MDVIARRLNLDVHEVPTPPERLTRITYLVGVIACLGGISFGYEGPIVSGLIINAAFLQAFDDHSGRTSELSFQSSSYCKLNSPPLQLYISCSFITAALATAAAATWVDRFGRKNFILAAAALILAANVLQTAAAGRAMLFAGRLIMGIGQGFATFTVPMYVAEMSPPSVRGRMGTIYSIATTIGQLLAFAINQAVYASGLQQGWRISFAAVAWCPLVTLLLLTTVLPDTPSSLLQRGQRDQARHSFTMVRHSSPLRREQEWQGMCREAEGVIASKQQQQQQWGPDSSRQGSLIAQRLVKHAAAGQGDRHLEYDAAADVCDAPGAAQQGLQGPEYLPAAAAAVPDVGKYGSSRDDGSCTHPATATPAAAANKPALTALQYVSANLSSSFVIEEPAGAAAAAAAGGQVQGGTGSVWPALIITVHLTVVRSFNGFVSIMYFTALLFAATGNSTRNSLLAQTLMGAATLIGGVTAMLGIDKIGRQPLLAWMGLAMACLMAAAAAILGTGLPPSAVAAGGVLSPSLTAALMVVLCLWQVSFWTSWGPCFYVVLSELYPLQSRARGVGWGMVSFNLGVVVVLSLGGSMLCAMTYWLLVLFAGVNLYLALFAAAALPETKSRGLHEVAEVYRHHWLWRHVYNNAVDDDVGIDKQQQHEKGVD